MMKVLLVIWTFVRIGCTFFSISQYRSVVHHSRSHYVSPFLYVTPNDLNAASIPQYCGIISTGPINT